VLERLLNLHVFDNPSADPTVSARRIQQGLKSVAALEGEFKGRLRGVFGDSRMAVVLRLFVAYSIIAVAELGVLLLHGLFGLNVIDWLARIFS
jgi:hypothetical protein